MTSDDLYKIEIDVFREVERIKREKEEYCKGVEHGASLMLEAVRAVLVTEETNALCEKGAEQ